MEWQFHPLVLPPFIASIVAALLAGMLWRRRMQRGALTVMVLMLSAGLWALAEAGELGSVTIPAKLWWTRLRYLGILPIPYVWLIFSLQYARGRNWRTPPLVWALAIIPATHLVMVWTNEQHRLIWETYWLHVQSGLTALASERGPWYWLITAYSYIFIVAGAGVLVRAAVRTHRRYRWQIFLLLAGISVPLAANFIFLLRASPIPYLDLTPLSFTFSAVLLVWVFLRHGLLMPPVPVGWAQIIESMEDGVIICDLEGCILELNPAAQTMLGHDREHMLGAPVNTLITLPPGAFSVCSSWHTVCGGTRHIDLRTAALWARWAGVVGHVITLRDVTAWHLAELEQRRLFTAIECCAEDVLITDHEGRIVYINPAFTETTGYRRDEVLGQTPAFLQDDETNGNAYARLLETIEAGEPWQGIVTTRRKDGGLMEEKATISPIFDKAGRILGTVSVKRDITEERAIEENQRQTQRLESLGVLAGGIAHDFNNLLSIILGSTEIVLHQTPKDAPYRHNLDNICASVERATQLCQQILAYAGEKMLYPQTLDLNNAVEEMTRLLNASRAPKVALESRLTPGLPPIHADRSQVSQVIMNLFTNAVEAIGDEPGAITLTTGIKHCDPASLVAAETQNICPDTSYVYFEVADTGPGIAPEDMGHIFDPFFTTKFAGRGLGLAAVFGIMRAHNGAIELENTQETGTTFRALFPPAK
ncbi:MAG: histidine kinase N-terminal 7TM domain-containing protein [Candidatus Hydrogenedentota bacterium]